MSGFFRRMGQLDRASGPTLRMPQTRRRPMATEPKALGLAAPFSQAEAKGPTQPRAASAPLPPVSKTAPSAKPESRVTANQDQPERETAPAPVNSVVTRPRQDDPEAESGVPAPEDARFVVPSDRSDAVSSPPARAEVRAADALIPSETPERAVTKNGQMPNERSALKDAPPVIESLAQPDHETGQPHHPDLDSRATDANRNTSQKREDEAAPEPVDGSGSANACSSAARSDRQGTSRCARSAPGNSLKTA
jgi:hypothetical protein